MSAAAEVPTDIETPVHDAPIDERDYARGRVLEAAADFLANVDRLEDAGQLTSLQVRHIRLDADVFRRHVIELVDAIDALSGGTAAVYRSLLATLNARYLAGGVTVALSVSVGGVRRGRLGRSGPPPDRRSADPRRARHESRSSTSGHHAESRVCRGTFQGD